MSLAFVSVLGLVATALATVIKSRSDRVAFAIGTIGAIIASAVGLVGSAWALAVGQTEVWQTQFDGMLGPLNVGIDPLSAFFLLCIFLIGGLSAVYGAGYLRGHAGEKRLAWTAMNFNLLLASMVVIVLARDAILFLVGWEIMSVSSFFLVTYDSEHENVRRAGLVYLAASHASVLFLFLLFVVLSIPTGQFDFAVFSTKLPTQGMASLSFLLAVAGFGIKAGFWPLHFWLPSAHPAAPSHVSALMSGVMIKMGIYGLLRTFDFLGAPQVWWGGLLLGLGALSGVLGVLHALAQNDLKRLLAYSSVENIGIIVMGLGVGLLGRCFHNSTVAFLGFAGGLLHVLNHGLFKSLLFQSAGSVLYATGTREMNHLGGLYKKMPHTGLTFLIGAVAISGLPPLNGFVSEYLIYVGAFRSLTGVPMSGSLPAIVVIVALALIGALATASFVKAFGVVFLGELRLKEAVKVHEVPWLMRAPQMIGAALCVILGLGAVFTVQIVSSAAMQLAKLDAVPPQTLAPPMYLVVISLTLVALVGGLALLRWLILRKRDVNAGPTWGCGYSAPTPRMQYTATSFARPALSPFLLVFRRSVHSRPSHEPFSPTASYDEHLDDWSANIVDRMVFRFSGFLDSIAFLQHGRVQLYLSYVLATMIALLIWQTTGEAL